MSSTLTIPIRIHKSTTSITIKKSTVALWILLCNIKRKNIKSRLSDFVYSCLSGQDSWKGKNAKGFSDFVSERMIKSFLEKEDLRKYEKILIALEDMK